MSYYDPNLLAPLAGLELIRLGRNKDGGYVVPRLCLSYSQYLLSAGIYTDWSFEDEFISSAKLIEYILVDPTTSIQALFRATTSMCRSSEYSSKSKLIQIAHLLYNCFRVPAMRHRYGDSFVEAFLAPSDSSEPRIRLRPQISIERCLQLMSLQTLTSSDEPSVFFKLDIEGGEYGLTDDLLKFSHLYSGLALEVHDLDVMYSEFSYLMESLLSKGFSVAHCHPNNAGGVIAGTNLPRLLEITFINNKLLPSQILNQKNAPFTYQSKLDFPCDPSRSELEVSTNTPLNLNT